MSARRLSLKLLAVCALGAATASCAATMGNSSGLQRDLDSLRVSVDRLRQEQVESEARLESLAGGPATDLEPEMLALRDRMDALEAQLRALAQGHASTGERLGGLTYDVEKIRLSLEDLEGRAAGPGNDPAAAAGTVLGSGSVTGATSPALSNTISTDEPATFFQTAYADYIRGNYELAALGFRSVLTDEPDGVLADDALYYLGEIAAAQGRVEEALGQFTRVADDYPDGDKVATAILKKGLLLIEANRIGEGVVQLDHLVKNYPGSDEAHLARNKLRALGVGP